MVTYVQLAIKLIFAIIQSMESQSNTPDNMLKELISIWEYKISDENTDQLTTLILQVVLFVVTELLHNQVVLLPHVSLMFIEAYVVFHSCFTRPSMPGGW